MFMLFFCQAEDGIRDADVTGVQTCALPISSSSPSSLMGLNGTLFFAANNGTNGAELWRSDGTAGGTVLFKDINPGSASSSPAGLASVGDILFLRASGSTSGAELWSSDGSAAGSAWVQDINPGSA